MTDSSSLRFVQVSMKILCGPQGPFLAEKIIGRVTFDICENELFF